MLLTRALRLAVGVALVATACGSPGAAPSPTPAPDDPGAFPERPQFLDDFSDRASGWPDQAYADGALVLGGGRLTRVAAPVAIDPGRTGTLLEAEVTLDGESGAAGLFCRGSDEGGYEFTLSTAGAWRVQRVDATGERVLGSGEIPEGDLSAPGEPILLRFVCGAGAAGEPVSLGFTVNATTLSFVRDPGGLEPPGSSSAGVLIAGGSTDFSARFDNFALWLAEPE